MDANIFDDAPIIHSYTRAEALADGELVELDPKLCREAGFTYSVAVTRALFATVIDLTPAAKRAGNDVAGRTWDVLWMARLAVRGARGGRAVEFEVRAVVDRVRPSRVQMQMVCGPGDEGEPVLTISLPGEN